MRAGALRYENPIPPNHQPPRIHPPQQTGSGKTYTMFGPNVDSAGAHGVDGAPDEQRGLVPRVLEYLFAHVAREERRNGGRVRYLCRCSFYEIFNERVFDLLDAGCSLGGLQVRCVVWHGVACSSTGPIDPPLRCLHTYILCICTNTNAIRRART